MVNNKQFLGFNTNPTSVLYVSTEISELQLKERLEITGYTFKPNSFFFVQKDEQHKLCIRDDLLLDLKGFSETYNGRYETDINNYSDVIKNMFDKYRELAKKYNLGKIKLKVPAFYEKLRKSRKYLDFLIKNTSNFKKIC